MKKLVCCGLVSLMLLSGLSACAAKPKPEDALIAFFDAMKSDIESDYLDYFDTKVDYLETDPTAETTPEEITQQMNDLLLNFDYEIKKTELSEDGKGALVTVELVTVNMGSIFNSFMWAYIAKAFELAFSGSTEEELNQLAITMFLEASKDAPKDKLSVIEVKMNLVDKKWMIEGGETNKAFIDAFMGGMITTMEAFEEMNTQE